MQDPVPPVLLDIREVVPQNWDDLARLFESRGGPKNCWCMLWRATPAESKDASPANRKAALKRRVDQETPVGLLGYLDGEPVAWCSIAPRSTYQLDFRFFLALILDIYSPN